MKNRWVLGTTVKTNLPTAVEPAFGERAALLVSQAAEERETLVRWIDEAAKMSPIVRLTDEWVVTSYARADGKRQLVTSDGERLCVARFAVDQDKPEARACEKVDPEACAVKGDRLMLISLEDMPRKTKPGKPRVDSPKPTKKPAAKPAVTKKPTPKKPKKPAATKKKKPSTNKQKFEKKPELVRREVEVVTRWVTSDGFGEAKKAGLKFFPALDGLSIADAKSSSRGVELAWFERDKPSRAGLKQTKGALGWAAIRLGAISDDGVFDEKTKTLLVEGDLDWGFLRGFIGPRLMETAQGLALVTQKMSRGGPCELTRIGDVAPTVLSPSVCAIDPRVGPGGAQPAFDAILKADPKRRPGQPKHDSELVAWAGDRAYFVNGDGRTLHSAARDGLVREETAPFVARRARMTWAQVKPDGTGTAIVDGQTFVVNASGDVRLDESNKPKTITLHEFGRRTSALPGGGSWTSDRERSKVVWVGADGREKASATWPAGQAEANCRDGLPGKRFVPSIEPGQFVEVPELTARGICVVSEPVWAIDGSLRWFGTFAEGLDVLPEVRVLKDLGKVVLPSNETPVAAVKPNRGPCPPEMVFVDGKLCVDRFEATLLDMETSRVLSPDFPVTPNLFDNVLGDWATGRSRTGRVHARAMPLPFVPEWQRGKKFEVMAVPRPHARPNGYLTGLVAESACTNAGKRLCTLPEFVLACRGQDDTQFPYGDTYLDGVCNVNRDVHPAATLHDNASIGHLDPRLNRVRVNGETLLRETGSTPSCKSRWGNDAIYDLVGNLDEWVDEEGGAFAGGFYARSTRNGCDAVITAHPKSYLDYSTGVRCCKDAGN